MSRRRLTAALGALAAAAIIAVVVAGRQDHKPARPTTATNTVPLATVRGRSFVLYGKSKRAQFVNHADDRARGDQLNSFNADTLQPPADANTGKKGTRAGDNALLSLTLYSDPDLTRVVGTATYSCTFNFAQEATCDGQFDVGGGTIIALGPARLDGSEVTLAVTGGTGPYAGTHGQVTSTTPNAKKNMQIFRFRLL